VRLVTDGANPLTLSRNARTLANLVLTERVDLDPRARHRRSRSAAQLKKRTACGWCTATHRDLHRTTRQSYSRALAGGP
jgi:hypothetical protein